MRAVIFDMDGLLIDSEPVWQEAEKKIFATVGLNLTESMCLETKGIRIDETVKYWYEKSKWLTKSCQQVASEISILASQLMLEKATPLEGVYDIINLFMQKKIPMAICSSSPYAIIHSVVNKLNLQKIFTIIHSAEEEEFGKPHPSAYITTAKKLGTAPKNCIVFEDSVTGMVAAKAASMKVVGVPETGQFFNTKFDFCDYKIPSLTKFEFNKAELLF